MFFELRQYHIHPGQQKAWVKCMEEEIIPFQVKMGMVILGSFVGEEDESVYVWIRRFENEAERKRLYDAVYQSDYWKNEISPRVPTMIDREKIKVTRHHGHAALGDSVVTRGRRAAVRLHLWSGLVAGPLFLVLALSGAVLVFAPEIDRATRPPGQAPERSPLVAVRSLHASLHAGRVGTVVVGVLGLALVAEGVTGTLARWSRAPTPPALPRDPSRARRRLARVRGGRRSQWRGTRVHGSGPGADVSMSWCSCAGCSTEISRDGASRILYGGGRHHTADARDHRLRHRRAPPWLTCASTPDRQHSIPAVEVLP